MLCIWHIVRASVLMLIAPLEVTLHKAGWQANLETTLLHASPLTAAGEHYSIADIAASPYLALLPAAGASNLIDSRPGVKAWNDRILK